MEIDSIYGLANRAGPLVYKVCERGARPYEVDQSSVKRKSLTNPHDRYFREAMSHALVAKEVFQTCLDRGMIERIDWTRLELQNKSFIDDQLKLTISDVLYKTQIDGQDGYLYLLAEHQRQSDELMPFRLVNYMMGIMNQHLKQHKTKVLPLIIPLVIYHGKSTWLHSMDIFSLFKDSQLAKQTFFGPYTLIDLKKTPDEKLEHFWGGLMLKALKYIDTGKLFHYLRYHFLDDVRLLHNNTKLKQLLTATLKYGLNAGNCQQPENIKQWEYLMEQLNEYQGENYVTFADVLRQEGWNEGKQEGREKALLETAKRMLKAGIDPQLIKQVTTLSEEQLKTLT